MQQHLQRERQAAELLSQIELQEAASLVVDTEITEVEASIDSELPADTPLTSEQDQTPNPDSEQ